MAHNYIIVMLLLIGITGCAHHQPTFEIDKDNYPKIAEVRLQLGLEYLKNNKLLLAERNLRRALSYNQNDYRIHLGLALCSQTLGKNKDAEYFYQNALSLSQRNGIILDSYGVFLCGLNQYESAQYYFSEAMTTDYDITSSLVNSALCYLQEGNHTSASQMFEKAIELASTISDMILAKAENLFVQGEHQKAEQYIMLYRTVMPATSRTLWLKIKLAAAKNNRQHILDYAQQLANNFPQSQQYQQYLANEY